MARLGCDDLYMKELGKEDDTVGKKPEGIAPEMKMFYIIDHTEHSAAFIWAKCISV